MEHHRNATWLEATGVGLPGSPNARGVALKFAMADVGKHEHSVWRRVHGRLLSVVCPLLPLLIRTRRRSFDVRHAAMMRRSDGGDISQVADFLSEWGAR
jgi:hypothetical protein